MPACQGDWSPINTTRSIKANEVGLVHCSRVGAAFLLNLCLHAGTQVVTSIWEHLSLLSNNHIFVAAVAIVTVVIITSTFQSGFSILLKSSQCR